MQPHREFQSPFIPVHVIGSNREIQLQRAAMPRIIEGESEDPKKIQPRTTLIRVGLDQDPKDIYKLYEEEVPRSGVRLYHSYRHYLSHLVPNLYQLLLSM